MKQEDKEHLTFIYNRMIEIHGENPNVDYMLRFNTIIGNKPTIIPISDKIYSHEDLHVLFFEEIMPEKDFKFIAMDGLTYLFIIDKFNWYLSEERRDNVIDMISTINGNIKWMVELGIAKPLF